jgi:hypothetical protein
MERGPMALATLTGEALLMRQGWTRSIRVLAGTAAIAAMAACDVVRQAPAGSTISLVASTNVLGVNGEAEVIALVVRSGSAAPPTPGQGGNTPTPSGIVVNDGTLVTFSTTLGRLEPVEARTTNGQAIVKLIADGRSGTATITAISGAASGTMDVKIGVAGATKLVLTANPQVLPAGGGTTSISARAEDAQGVGLSGVPVNFSSTTGVLSATSVLTNNLGIATTILETATAATVTAAMGAATGQSATINITVTPGANGGF